MQLILWRHAEAADGAPDSARELTAKGHKQAARVAEWLAERLPKDVRILVSPARRTQQTAGAIGRTFETVSAVGTSASATDLLEEAGWPDNDRDVLVVGHQPTLGEVAALLLLEEERPLSIKKGAVWWFTSRARDGSAATILRAVIGPDLVD